MWVHTTEENKSNKNLADIKAKKRTIWRGKEDQDGYRGCSREGRRIESRDDGSIKISW